MGVQAKFPVLADALNRLAKWRMFFVSWQLGTRPGNDPEAAAIRDHREVTLLLRAEMSALVTLLVQKNLITEAEWVKTLREEAEQMNKDLERRFPGWRATGEGMVVTNPEGVQTTRDLNFRR